MIIKVAYFGYVRKDGNYNNVIFDTTSKEILHGYISNCTFVEAKMSRDVDTLRRDLIAEGYTDTILLQ